MKNIYDLLNNVKVNPEDYEEAPLNDIERAAMKQNFHRSQQLSKKKAPHRWAAAVACVVCVVCFSQTAFAKTAINGILQNISLGHDQVIQMDPSASTGTPQFYDKDGKPITHVDGTFDVYDAKGNKLMTVTGKKDTGKDDGTVTVKELNKAVSQLSFVPKLPKQLPADYKYDHANLFVDESGKPSGDYLILNYLNGDKNVKVSERRITPETTQAIATDATVEKLKVNGHDAALIGGHKLEWEDNGVSLTLSAESLTKDELLAFAQSIA